VTESLNAVAFKRGYFISQRNGNENELLALSLQAELMRLGFMFSSDAYESVKGLSREQIVAYHDEIVPIAKALVGAKRNYRPFYVNFPQQVMEMSNIELFFNAILHYWSDGTWEPPQELTERGLQFEHSEFRLVTLKTEDEFKADFTKLVSVNSALTDADKTLVEWFIGHYGNTLSMPRHVPFKETLCLLATRGLNVPVKTATDVLRIAVSLSGGDISLPNVPKPAKAAAQRRGFGRQGRARTDAAIANREQFRFTHFKRGQRRYLLELLEKVNPDISEMQGRLERWLRLGEILHPGEFKSVYPKTYEAFRALRNQPPRVRTFSSQLEDALKSDLPSALTLLSKRPGEFARRLDYLLRSFDSQVVLSAFGNVADQVSSKVLFELYGHLQSRLKASVRSVALKGKGSKVRVLKELPALPAGAVTQAKDIIRESLTASLANLPPLGSVWIDPRLIDVPVPYGMRGINTAIKTYVRGTHIPFRRDATTIRPFVHWHDKSGTEDLDLSAGFLTADFEAIEHLSYTNLKSGILNACHSGDIRHRRGSCAEYVDVDIQTAINRGIRYVTIQVFNFNGGPMHTVDECYFGLMEREHPQSNEIFEPRTVSNAMTLANESTSVLICVVDLVKRVYIWMDIETNRALAFYENTESQTVATVQAILEGNRMSVYELLEMHGNARGQVTEDQTKATTIFLWDDFICDYAKTASYLTFA